MNKQQKIEQWTRKIDALVKMDKELREVTCLLSNQLAQPLYTAMDNVIESCDYRGWVIWFICNNGSKLSLMTVTIGKKRKEITTSKQLATVIVNEMEKEETK